MACDSRRLFAIPLDEAKVGDIYHLLLHVMRDISCIALTFDGFFSLERCLALIGRLSKKDIYGDDFVDDFIATIPDATYVPPCEYTVKNCCAYGLSEEMVVAKRLDKLNIWLLATSLFGNSSGWLLSDSVAAHDLDEIIEGFAFIVGFDNIFLERLTCNQTQVDFAMIPSIMSKKTYCGCMVLWGGNADVVAKLSVACERAGVNAFDTIDF